MLKVNLPFNLNLSEEKQKLISTRYNEFQEFFQKSNEEWFSELCFCILTANSQAKRAIEIQNFLGAKGFLENTEAQLAQVIRSHGHRFHNNKAKYIVNARKLYKIKEFLSNLDDYTAREFLVKNIMGIGYKEASHFLRNVGYTKVAIIDRHILKFLLAENLIPFIPKTVSKKDYLNYENILSKYCSNLSLLDLMIWCHMTGEVLK